MGRSNLNFQHRRKFPRRLFRRGISILCDGIYDITKGVEIGEGGVSFETAQQLPEGKLLVVSFQIPSGGFVSVMAEVRNYSVDTQGVGQLGCAFRNLKFDNRREIRLYVSAR